MVTATQKFKGTKDWSSYALFLNPLVLSFPVGMRELKLGLHCGGVFVPAVPSP